MIRLSFPMVVGLLLLASPLASARQRRARPPSERSEAQAAAAAAKEAKDAKERAAKKACLTGDPDKGVELLTDLFIDTNDPTYIYNQGRCYEQSNRYEDAIGRFREYLRKARRASSAERADAEKHIADCQALLEQERPAAPTDTAAESPPVIPFPTASPPPETPPAPAEGVVTKTVAPVSSSGSSLRTAGLVTGVLGLAALGGAIAMNVKYNNMTDGLLDKWDNGVESSRNDYKTMAIIGYSAGAVGVATGVLLYIVGLNAGEPTVAPAVVAGSPGAAFSGGF